MSAPEISIQELQVIFGGSTGISCPTEELRAKLNHLYARKYERAQMNDSLGSSFAKIIATVGAFLVRKAIRKVGSNEN